jgi:exopolysaccharide biosynthesis polyprenyl glycosylphosphotransferase
MQEKREGSQDMQHDLEQNMSMTSLQSSDELDHEVGPVHERLYLQTLPREGQREIRRRQKPSPAMWRLILMLGDGFLLLALLTYMTMLVPLFQLEPYFSLNGPGVWSLKLMWECIALVSWGIAVSISKAQDLESASNRLKSPLKITFALVVMVIFWMALYAFLTDRISSTAKSLLLFLVIAVPTLGLWRVVLAELMNLPRFRRKVVIIGATIAGETIARELRSSKRATIDLLGYISEHEDEGKQNEGLPVLGNWITLHRLAHNGIIDTMIMALDYKENPKLFQEAIGATQLGITLIPMTMAYERMRGKIPVEHIGDQWCLALPIEIVVSPLYTCWRKAMDITFGLLGMAILLLILPIMALLISLDSQGPIFYKQERLGRSGRKFCMYKFRSMYTDAEQAGRAIWATQDDARVTRVGRFMRATHLDELPQAFNIFHGDMSLIGPRPERETFVKDLEKTIPFYRCRLMVKPGLTGWAQVKYCYAKSDHDALVKLQYDLYYIKHQSMMLDVFIILKTMLEVLGLHGT